MLCACLITNKVSKCKCAIAMGRVAHTHTTRAPFLYRKKRAGSTLTIYYNGNRFRSRVSRTFGNRLRPRFVAAGIQCASSAEINGKTPFQQDEKAVVTVNLDWRGGLYKTQANCMLMCHRHLSTSPSPQTKTTLRSANLVSTRRVTLINSWERNLCQDGDVESNPGPLNSLSGQVSCRIASFRKHAISPKPNSETALNIIRERDSHVATIFNGVTSLPDSITISIHNPDGLQNGGSKCLKLDDPDFMANYDGSDIVIIPESHSDLRFSDSLVAGWTVVNAPRQIRHTDDPNRKASTSSGGVMVLISNTIVDGVDIAGVRRLEGICVVPLKPTFRKSREGKSITILGVYAPPQTSKFVKHTKGKRDGDVLSTLDSEIRRMKQMGHEVICGGDFNSYIGRECDYLCISDVLNLTNSEFSTDGLKLDRSMAEGNGRNTHGNKLNTTLARHDMVTVNGLSICGTHVGDGSPTHYGRQHGSATCIDLFCISLGLLKHEISLKVLPCGGSDGCNDWGHRVVTLVINLDNPEKSHNYRPGHSSPGPVPARPKVRIFEHNLQNQSAIDAMGERISNTKSLISWCLELAGTDPDHWTPELLEAHADKLAQAIYDGVRSSQSGSVRVSQSRPPSDNLKSRSDKRSKIERKIHDKASKTVASDDAMQALRKHMNNCIKRVHKMKRMIAKRGGDSADLQEELERVTHKMRQATCMYKAKKKERLDHELQKEFEKWVIGIKDKPLETWKVLKSLLRSSSDSSNPIDGPTWVKHFERIYVDGKISDAPRPESISDQIEMWERYFKNPDLRSEIYGLKNDPNCTDQNISLEETTAAVKRLNAAASAGIDGLDGRVVKSILKNPKMIEAMHTLCDLIYQNKCIPTNWVRAKLVALKKPGKCKSDPDGYRGIAILNVIGKVYGIIIEEKLYRAANIPEEQVGAIRNLSTTDACVALRTLAEKYAWNWGAMNAGNGSAAASSPVVANFIRQNFSDHAQRQIINASSCEDDPGRGFLITCFIDIKKAFPGVIREVMFNKIAGIDTVNDKLLMAVAKTCNSFSLQVETDMGPSDVIQTRYGIPEGLVLSPLLWALSKIDFVEGAGHDRDGTPKLFGKPTSTMMFVDDESLSKLSPSSMQKSLDQKCQYMRDNGAIPNVDKTEVVVFHDPQIWDIHYGGKGVASKLTHKVTGEIIDLSFTMEGQRVRIVPEFKYLGVLFSATGTWEKHFKKRAMLTRASLAKVTDAFRQIRAAPFGIWQNLCESMVQGMAIYGAETTPFDMDNWEQIRRTAQRWVTTASDKTSRIAMDAVTNMTPFDARAVSNRVGFLCRAVNQWGWSLAGRAVLESVTIGMRTGGGWLHETISLLMQRGIGLPRLTIDTCYRSPKCIATTPKEMKHNAHSKAKEFCQGFDIYGKVVGTWARDVRKKLQAKNETGAYNLVLTWGITTLTTPPDTKDGPSPITYTQRFLSNIVGHQKFTTTVQFLMGLWRLGRILKGRGTEHIACKRIHSGPISDAFRRKCPWCWVNRGVTTCEDEMHLLLDCPQYDTVRTLYWNAIAKELAHEIPKGAEREALRAVWWGISHHDNREVDCRLELPNSILTISRTKYHIIANALASLLSSIRSRRCHLLKKPVRNAPHRRCPKPFDDSGGAPDGGRDDLRPERPRRRKVVPWIENQGAAPQPPPPPLSILSTQGTRSELWSQCRHAAAKCYVM